jgi:hypothetical protein
MWISDFTQQTAAGVVSRKSGGSLSSAAATIDEA